MSLQFPDMHLHVIKDSLPCHLSLVRPLDGLCIRLWGRELLRFSAAIAFRVGNEWRYLPVHSTESPMPLRRGLNRLSCIADSATRSIITVKAAKSLKERKQSEKVPVFCATRHRRPKNREKLSSLSNAHPSTVALNIAQRINKRARLFLLWVSKMLIWALVNWEASEIFLCCSKIHFSFSYALF